MSQKVLSVLLINIVAVIIALLFLGMAERSYCDYCNKARPMYQIKVLCNGNYLSDCLTICDSCRKDIKFGK